MPASTLLTNLEDMNTSKLLPLLLLLLSLGPARAGVFVCSDSETFDRPVSAASQDISKPLAPVNEDAELLAAYDLSFDSQQLDSGVRTNGLNACSCDLHLRLGTDSSVLPLLGNDIVVEGFRLGVMRPV